MSIAITTAVIHMHHCCVTCTNFADTANSSCTSVLMYLKHHTILQSLNMPCILQDKQGPWLLQGIQILDKSSGREFYFPCLHWLDTLSSVKSKLVLGSRPPTSGPPHLAKALSELPAQEEEEEWQNVVSNNNEMNAVDTNDRGLGGCYTVRCRKFHITECACSI